MSTVKRYLLALVVLLAATAGLTREASAQSTCAVPGPNCCRTLNECWVSPTGTDGAQGTQADPWKTLQYAVDTIESGDTIWVTPGTYVGFRVRLSGTAAAPKAIRATCPAIDPACAGSLAIINTPSPVSRHQSLAEVEQNPADDPAGNVIQYWTIEGFRITGSPRYGVDCRVTRFIRILDNLVENSFLTGIFFAHSDDTLVEGNESRNNDEHGVYAADSSHRPTIRRNYLHHNEDSGVQMNGGLGTGAGNGIIESPLVEQNEISYNGSGGGAALNCDGVNGGLFRNNMVYENSATGIALFKGNGAIASSNNKIYNNTFAMAPDSRWVVLISRTGTVGGVNNEIKNNILYTANPQRGSIATYSTSRSVLQSDYNVVTNRFNTNGGQTNQSITFNQWRNRGQDRSSRRAPSNINELFVNPAADDYHILPGSVAHNTGVFLGALVPDDFDLQPRTDGRYDIGADEIVPPSLQGPADASIVDALCDDSNWDGDWGGNWNVNEDGQWEWSWNGSQAECVACVQTVCAFDPWCCSNEFDSLCVSLADSFCQP